MNCPQCRLPLQKSHLGDAAIEECPQCRGIWFDPNTIDEVKDDIAPDLRWMDFELWRKNADFQVLSDPLHCPRCTDIALTTVSESESGIYIKFCTRCGGNWLSAADLTRIISELDAEADHRSAADYFRESFRQAGELLTGKGDTMSQWQDLKAVLRLFKYRVFVENPQLNTLMKGLQKTLPL